MKKVLCIILIIVAFQSSVLSQSKTISTVDTCDTAAMEKAYIDCYANAMTGVEDNIKSSYYKQICRDEAKTSNCGKAKAVLYKKDGEILKTVLCSKATKRSDIKLCKE